MELAVAAVGIALKPDLWNLTLGVVIVVTTILINMDTSGLDSFVKSTTKMVLSTMWKAVCAVVMAFYFVMVRLPIYFGRFLRIVFLATIGKSLFAIYFLLIDLPFRFLVWPVLFAIYFLLIDLPFRFLVWPVLSAIWWLVPSVLRRFIWSKIQTILNLIFPKNARPDELHRSGQVFSERTSPATENPKWNFHMKICLEFRERLKFLDKFGNKLEEQRLHPAYGTRRVRVHQTSVQYFSEEHSSIQTNQAHVDAILRNIEDGREPEVFQDSLDENFSSTLVALEDRESYWEQLPANQKSAAVPILFNHARVEYDAYVSTLNRLLPTQAHAMLGIAWSSKSGQVNDVLLLSYLVFFLIH